MTRVTLLASAATLLATSAFAVEMQAGDTLAEDQSLDISVLDQAKTLDPQLIEETIGNHMARQLFEGLTRQDADGNLIPAVATEWTSDDNQTWTFKLRDDARWSNGDPVTAQDFVYAWQRAADPATASPYAWYVELTSIENAAEIVAGEADPSTLGVEAVDDHTLQVTLTQPLPFFPAMTTYSTLYPAHRATIEAHGDDWTSPENMVSNGAYILDEVKVNEFTRLVPNPEYHSAEDVAIEEITVFVVNDRNQSLTRYQAGEFDMMDDLPAGTYPDLKAEFPDETHSTPRLCSYYYAINLTDSGHEALQDERVREALSYAVNRDVIVEQVLKGGQSPAYNFTHEATAGFEMPEIDYASWSQDERTQKARDLIAEAGYGPDNPIELDLIYNTSENHKAIATVVSQMWKPLGVNTTLSNYEWQSYIDIRGEQNFDIARSAWCGDYNEASTFLDLVTTTHGANDGKYSNPEVDRLMAESRTMEDPNVAYTQVEQILADEMGIIPIYHYTQNFMLDPSIRNWPMNNVENNWYVQDMYRAASE
ncbi:peptide ABC transporter substrate-binding protein [Jannaschia sp. S6380]|uniref:peptide ABC transporter substrate-binding protein n=1 Tax=Jannaschia sp. S6380 TaxID=2926408 RepID=UPI001FF475D6|nr:peptide ABC transporter substrate-binding protein [Jannaschia sp. S6380]MCK0167706.1 peptide ABC transporter substrate-binding protein [Jannaschia sp. S6380]